MDRPSHWILALLGLVACTLGLAFWVSGGQRIPIVTLRPAATAPQGTKQPLIGEGFVKLENGEAGADAEVLLLGTDTRVRADDTGRFRIALPFRECTLVAHDRSRLVAVGAPFQPTRDHGLLPVSDLVLTEGARVQGRVREESGAPLPGARIVIRGSLGRREATSGPDGGFGVAGLVAETASVEVAPLPGKLGLARQIAIAPQGTSLELVLASDEPLRVLVVDAEGAAKANVTVMATDSEARRAEATSDASGYATLSGVARGNLTFAARNARGELLPVLGYDATRERLTLR